MNYGYEFHQAIQGCATKRKKSCTIQEYTVKDSTVLGGLTVDSLAISNLAVAGNVTKTLDDPDDVFVLTISISDPESSRGGMTIIPQVRVHQEYLVWTWYSLLGNAGGQMGLWVGFSFIGTTTWALNLFKKIWEKNYIKT